jgi:probable HAF family extracellular repeat protein
VTLGAFRNPHSSFLMIHARQCVCGDYLNGKTGVALMAKLPPDYIPPPDFPPDLPDFFPDPFFDNDPDLDFPPLMPADLPLNDDPFPDPPGLEISLHDINPFDDPFDGLPPPDPFEVGTAFELPSPSAHGLAKLAITEPQNAGRPNLPTSGFLLHGGTLTRLNDPLASPGSTEAWGVNDTGQVVGFYSDANGHQHGYLYGYSNGS